MKVSAATPKPTTRKETYGKEVTVMFLKKINKDERDQEERRVPRAAIYLREPAEAEDDDDGDELSIAQQRVLCRHEARRLEAEVVGEFVDDWPQLPLGPGLHMALEAAQEKRLDFLIVSSMDQLIRGPQSTFEVAWRLGHAGTFPIPSDHGR
jgi:hypothetical protein